MESALAFAQAGYHSSDFEEAVQDWLALCVTDISHSSLERLARSIPERIRYQAHHMYVDEAVVVCEREGGRTRTFAFSMASWVESQAKKLNRKFPEPIAE